MIMIDKIENRLLFIRRRNFDRCSHNNSGSDLNKYGMYCYFFYIN